MTATTSPGATFVPSSAWIFQPFPGTSDKSSEIAVNKRCRLLSSQLHGRKAA
jgi:hypothetical protein